MSEFPGARIANRRSIALTQIPTLAVGEVASVLAAAIDDQWRIISLFGVAERDDQLRLIAVSAHDEASHLAVLSTVVGSRYPALGATCRQAVLFEREILEQCGAVPIGGPPLSPLRRHPPDHAPIAWRIESGGRDPMPFSTIAGDEVHEVAVGPVHAGIIEPGHFRIQAHGEEILSLELMLGYQHRGVERLLETLPQSRAMYVAESIAGDSVIAHASAYCGAIEALARSQKSPRAQTIRAIGLELERLANHLGDLGAISGDVAYQPAAAYFGRLRGECLNLLMTISGNRYGRGLVRLGGVRFDIDADMGQEIERRIGRLARDVRQVAEEFFGAASVQARLEGVGVIHRDQCKAAGFVGPVARACDVPRDVRQDHPYGVFRFVQIPVSTAWAGDVYARALVRWLEIQRSLEFVAEQVRALPKGALRSPCGDLVPNELVVALEESWRGELAHVVLTDERGAVRRHKVIDPSFHNWSAVALALPGNQISDFPLCNKSFNLSYCGHDL